MAKLFWFVHVHFSLTIRKGAVGSIKSPPEGFLHQPHRARATIKIGHLFRQSEDTICHIEVIKPVKYCYPLSVSGIDFLRKELDGKQSSARLDLHMLFYCSQD